MAQGQPEPKGFFRIEVVNSDGWSVDVVRRADGRILIDIEGDNGDEDARVSVPASVAAALGAALLEVSGRVLGTSDPR